MQLPLNDLIEQMETMLSILKDAEDTPAQDSEDNMLNDIIPVAKANAYKKHILTTMDESVIKLYLTALTSLFINEDNNEIRANCFLALGKIIASVEEEIDFEKYTISCAKTDKAFWSDFAETMQDGLMACFLVDATIILSQMKTSYRLNESMELLADIVQIVGMPHEQFEKAMRLGKLVVEQDYDGLLDVMQAEDIIPYSYICPYFDDYDYDWVALTLEEGKCRKGSVLFVNMRIENMKDMLNFDEFHASEMTFINCYFLRIRGIRSSSPKLTFNGCVFEKNNILKPEKESWTSEGYEKVYTFMKIDNGQFNCCSFLNCKASKSLLELNRGSVDGCSFDSCCGVDMPQGPDLLFGFAQSPIEYLFRFIDVEIHNCKFDNCEMKTRSEKQRTTYGGLILVSNGKMTECRISNCSVFLRSSYGSYSNYFVRMVCVDNSDILNCSFEDCSCSTEDSSKRDVESFIVGYSGSGNHKNLQYKNCSSNNYRYSESTGNKHYGKVER